MKHYLAYGSNLNKEQMQSRCPDAIPVTSGLLIGYELAFRRGVLTIEPKQGGAVPFGIWEISPRDESWLDRYEGFPRFYRKEQINVVGRDGGEYDCMVYIMEMDCPIQCPSDFYFYTVMRGYTDFALEKKYLINAYSKAKWGDEE